MQPKTASAHNADLTGRVDITELGKKSDGSETRWPDSPQTLRAIIRGLQKELARLESENVLLRERLAAKTDGEET